MTLSPREYECALLVAQGHTNDEISAQLGIALGTVRVYISAALDKTGARNRVELAVMAVRGELRVRVKEAA